MPEVTTTTGCSACRPWERGRWVRGLPSELCGVRLGFGPRPGFAGELVVQVLEGDPEAALDSESRDRLAAFVERSGPRTQRRSRIVAAPEPPPPSK
jgi:hypothetical protein